MKKRSMARLLILLTVLLLAALPAVAETLQLPESLREIEAEAFCGDSSISAVELPEGVASIGSRAFADSSIVSIYLPVSLSDIAPDAFEGCAMTAQVLSGSYAEQFCIANGIKYELLSTPVESFTYTATETAVTITGYTGTDAQVVIPSQIDGVSVTTIGESAFGGNTAIQRVHIPSTVTAINSKAFQSCTNLENVTFSEGLVTIGNYAFNDCTSLQNPTLPTTLVSTGWNTFGNCDSLTELTFPDGFTTLGRYCFFGCDNLIRVNLPDSVTTIGERAFKDCISMTEFDYPIGWTSVYSASSSYGIFEGCSSLTEITIPEGVTETPKGAFAGSAYLQKVNLPSTLVTLGGWAFDGCTSLTEIELNEGLMYIGSYAFNCCSNLPNLEMPTTLVSTDWTAFGNCDSLTELTFPDGFTTLGRYCFFGCDRLIRVNLPDSVTTIGERAFKDCVSMTEFDYPIGWTSVYSASSSYGIFEGCSSLTEITIPEGVTETPKGAFAGSTYLQKVNLPSTLVTLGGWAFDVCTNLTEIELNEGLMYIGSYAFNCCSNLPNLEMPTTLVSVGLIAFGNCDSFTEITFHDGFTQVGESAFTACDKLVRVNLPDSVTDIGARAFEKCPSMTSFDYPLNWSSISSNWVYSEILRGTPNVTEIVVPEGVEYMPKWAFWGCSYIEKVTLPSTLKALPEYAFAACTSLTECDIPSSVHTILRNAFNGCTALRDIYITPTVTNFAYSYPVGGTPYWNNVFVNCSSELTIESEYGAPAIDFAKQFGINYYYLSYTGRNVPRGTVYKGDTFNLTGFVRSTLPLTDVTATVYDADTGEIVRQVQVAPGVTDYSLASYISEKMSIGTLELGKYTFTLQASTEKSAETFVRTSFTVAPPPLRVYLRGYAPFSGFISVDSDAVIAGTVVSNYPITSLAVQFILSEGASTVEYKAAPGTLTYDLSGLNIGVGALEPDAYEMQIVVQGNGETKIVGERSFSLTSDAIPEDFEVDYDLLSAFMADSGNREIFYEYTVDYTMKMEAEMTELERLNLVMSQREDYTSATIRDGLDELLGGVDDADTYLIELYKKEIADFIVDMGAEATTYQYDSALLQAIADSLSNHQRVDIDFIGSEYGEISEYDELFIKAIGMKIDAVSDTVDFADDTQDLIEIVGDFFKDYSRGLEILEFLEAEYVGNEQYQYAVDELKSEYYSNSYRAFNNLFDAAYKQAVENATEKLTEIILGEVYIVYEIVGFAEEVLDEVYDLYGDSYDYITYSVQCETFYNARAAYCDAFDLVLQDQTVVQYVAKLKRSFEITRLSAIRALETLMNMDKTYSSIDYTYPMKYLKELRSLTIGF